MQRETVIHSMKADGEIVIVIQAFRRIETKIEAKDLDTDTVLETRTSTEKRIEYGFGETVRCTTAHEHTRACAQRLLDAKWGDAPKSGPDIRRTLREELTARIDAHTVAVPVKDATPAERLLE